MKRILVTTLTILVLTTSCKADTFHMYKDEIGELLQDPKTRTFKGREEDVNDLSGCQFRLELGSWMLSKYGNEKSKNVRYIWDRSSSWRSGRIISSGGTSLDFSQKDDSSYVTRQSNFHPIYIGPWRSVILTHTEGSFFNSEKITEQKQIRFFAYYPKEGGNIQYQYESMTEENKSIPEKKFSLSPAAKIAPDRFSLCVVKWTARFGYNAIAEVKSKNPFSKNYLVPTGKIIEVEE